MADSAQEALRQFAPNAGNPVKYPSGPRGTVRYIAGLASPNAKAVHSKAGGTAGQEAAEDLTGNTMADLILAAAQAATGASAKNLSAPVKKDFNFLRVKNVLKIS
jgi:hypothetical protein